MLLLYILRDLRDLRAFVVRSLRSAGSRKLVPAYERNTGPNVGLHELAIADMDVGKVR